jgi:hypothetical protein
LLLSIVGTLFVGLFPRPGQTQFAVFAAPWRGLVETAEMVAAAGGAIVDAGGLPNVVIAYSDDPAFVDALYRAGAWLVLDPLLLRGCLGLAARRNPVLAKGEV